MLITLLIGLIIFCLAWWLISIIPLPPAPFPPFFKTILYIVLIVITIVWLLRLGHFV